MARLYAFAHKYIFRHRHTTGHYNMDGQCD